MKTQHWGTQLPRIVLFTLAVGMIVAACTQEPDLGLDLDKNTPLSFSFVGRTHAASFEILELPRTKPLSKTNPFSFIGETIWKMSAANGIEANKWPRITYGEIPSGFSQTVPDHAPPPKLAEGKLYAARILGERDATTTLFFEIRNGKSVNVSDKVMGP
jgi:hypothetical protein